MSKKALNSAVPNYKTSLKAAKGNEWQHEYMKNLQCADGEGGFFCFFVSFHK